MSPALRFTGRLSNPRNADFWLGASHQGNLFVDIKTSMKEEHLCSPVACAHMRKQGISDFHPLRMHRHIHAHTIRHTVSCCKLTSCGCCNMGMVCMCLALVQNMMTAPVFKLGRLLKEAIISLTTPGLIACTGGGDGCAHACLL
jgi:hypothetical protein